MKILRLLIASGLLVLTLPSITTAHEDAPSGPIKVELHVNPDDKPVAGQVSALSFDFTDDPTLFNLDKCDCTVEIKQDERVIARRVIDKDSIQAGGMDASFQYSFPKPGTYEVALSAKPRGGATFAAYEVEFPVNVSSAPSKPLPAVLWYGLITTILSLGAVIAFWPLIRSSLKR